MQSSWISAVLFVTAVVCNAAGAVTRINGGQDVAIENYASVVQVESVTALLWGQSCGGTILTPNYVMSAAQCFSGLLFSPSRRRIRAGSARRNRGGVVIAVKRVLNHPSYVSSTRESDISLVELQAAFIYGTTIYRATVVAQNFDLPDYLLVTEVGWGSISVSGSGSASRLQAAQVYTIPHELCSLRYGALNSPRPVTANMICSGGVEGLGSCDGDEGGPVFYDDIVVGIVSFHHGCGNGTIPNVNTRVASFTNWLIINAA